MQSDAEALWLLLPSHFRLEGDLMSCDRRPIERDFMVSARLNHLHVLFLLRLALVSAAGILCLALLHQSPITIEGQASVQSVVQDF